MDTNRIIINRKLRIDRAVRNIKIAIVVGGVIGITIGAIIADKLSNAFAGKVTVTVIENPIKD